MTTEGPLGAALEAERDGKWLKSLRLTSEHLGTVPDDPDALNLMGRLCLLGGDIANAVALQRATLRQRATHAAAIRDLAIALDARPDPVAARAIFDEMAARYPAIAFHVRAPGSIGVFPGIDEVAEALDRALVADPTLAAAHAARGNVHIRYERYASALEAYRRAALLEPDLAEVQLMLSEITEMLGEKHAAEEYRDKALALTRLYIDSMPRKGCPLDVLMLCASGPWSVNMPLDFAVDHESVRLHRLYLDANVVPPQLPHFDATVCAIGESEVNHAAIEAAKRLIDERGLAALNDPRRLLGLARPKLAETLRGVSHVTVLQTRRFIREELESQPTIAYPSVIRPIDTHRGEHFERIDDSAQVKAYLARTVGDRFDVTRFFDYRSADGYFRKYRVAIVDGIAYPYHLAISNEWMVHYITSAMGDHLWMREEEERFFADPRSVFPKWDNVFSSIANAVGLEYFGIDCTVDRAGNVAIFEMDASMLLHAHERDERFTYKNMAACSIFRALEKALHKLSGNEPTMHT